MTRAREERSNQIPSSCFGLARADDGFGAEAGLADEDPDGAAAESASATTDAAGATTGTVIAVAGGAALCGAPDMAVSERTATPVDDPLPAGLARSGALCNGPITNAPSPTEALLACPDPLASDRREAEVRGAARRVPAPPAARTSPSGRRAHRPGSGAGADCGAKAQRQRPSAAIEAARRPFGASPAPATLR